MNVTFFKSNQVHWKQGIHLKRARWHSCMQWGWSSINRGEHLARYSDYLVLSVCWHFYPRAITKETL